MKKIDQSIEFFGFEFFSSNMDRLLSFITSEKEQKSGKKTQLVSIFTPNPEQIVLACKDTAFKKDLQQADIRIPDGIGLIIAQKVMYLFGKSTGTFAERITGVELSLELLKIAKREGWKCLVIGGRGYSGMQSNHLRVQKVDAEFLDTYAEKNTKNNYRSQDIVYWLEGYADIKNPAQQEEALIEEALQTIKPAVVFVAFGAPYQEAWVVNNKESLEQNNVKIALVVGGAFDVILGKLKRAPHIIRRLGFEWLFRLFQEPHRWRRQLKLITFMKLLLRELVN